MSAELLGWLQESTVASSLALILVLVLRGPWRHLLGARGLPWLWALVPAAIVAVSLPAPSQSIAGIAVLQPVVVDLQAGHVGSATVDAVMPWAWAALWLAGVLLLALRLAAEQRRFSARLGRLRPGPDGCWIAETADCGPAVIGWLAPRIVLPADFAERYAPRQQALVLAHERTHLRHGDLHISLFASALRCLYWFNPLLHLAIERLRFDLELACDAATLAAHPRSRRSYADAMLNTQLAVPGLPVGCAWQSSHPLKKRIAMLNKPIAGRSRLLLSAVVAGCLSVGVGVAAWSSQAVAHEPVDAAAKSASDFDSSYRALKPPKYPAAALEAKESGSVLLRVLVGVDGKPKQIEVERSEPAGVFDQAAIDGARGWEFNPAQRAGKPVEEWVLVPIRFDINGEPDAPTGDLPESALDEIRIKADHG